jgi:hypothetical protein
MVSKAKATKGSVRAINYLLADKGHAIELDRNGIAGMNGYEILSEFREIQALNGNCVNNTYSIVISPSNEREFTPEQLTKIGRFYLKEMGLIDHQYLMTAHLSTDQPHIHIQCNRIGFDGKAHSDSNIHKRAQNIAEDIAKRLGMKTAKEIRQERIDKQKEDQAKNIPELLAILNEKCTKKSDTFSQYCKLMKAEGVEILPTLTSSGAIQGFRLHHLQSGENYKASEVKKCGIKHLTRAGVEIDAEITQNYAKIIERYLSEEDEKQAEKEPKKQEKIMLEKENQEQEERKRFKIKL